MESSFPRIGDPAPDFVAPSTQGELRLSQWCSDSWSLLLAFPAAFAPVSVSEIQELARKLEGMKEIGIQCLAIFPDTVQALLAWQRDLATRFSTKINIPFVSDTRLAIASQFGMIHPGASPNVPVRATFILDPRQTIRFVAYYPLANGRSIEELTRIAAALAASDRQQAPTPASWKPGQPLLKAPPTRFEELTELEPEKGSDFYFNSITP